MAAPVTTATLDTIEANLITDQVDPELLRWLEQLDMYEADQYLCDQHTFGVPELLDFNH